MTLEIWHNPRCSKSRATLALVEESGVAHRVRRYLEQPPSAAEIDAVLRRLRLEPEGLTRMQEPAAAEHGLRRGAVDRATWLAALAANPILIERPVVLCDDGRAIIGRPPENVLTLLGR